MSSYDILISKLDAFARRYYMNKALRGALILFAVFLSLFILFNFIEFKFYLPKWTRTIIAYGFLGSLTLFSYRWLIDPLLKYFKLGKRIDYEQSAQIIGDHFYEIKDKLINILQLKGSSHDSSDLVMASIQQKADDIKLVPFQNAVDLSVNRKYIKYVVPPLLLLLVLFITLPSLIKEGTYRYINNQKTFAPIAPFSFSYHSPDQPIVQFSNLPINLSLNGSKLPTEVDILINGYKYRMERQTADKFQYILANIQADTKIQFEANGYKSEEYHIHTLLRPKLTDFKLELDYPAYTKKPDQTLDNLGNAIVPEGTKVRWLIETENADIVKIEPFGLQQDGDGSLGTSIHESTPYSIQFGMSSAGLMDSLLFNLMVIKDQLPSISVRQFGDSSNTNTLSAFFAGEVTDDYGIRNLSLTTEKYTQDGQQISTNSTSLMTLLDDGLFTYQQNINDLGLSPGEYAQLYFTAVDNDAIHGYKSARSQIFTFNRLSIDELKEDEEIAENDILDKASQLKQQQIELRKAAEQLRNNLLQQKEISWQDEKKLEELMQKQDEISEESKELQELLEKLKKQQEQYKEKDEEIQQKEEMLEELVEKATDDRIEDLLEKIKELFDKQQKDQAINQLQQTQTESQQKEMDYERLQELYKQLEVETDLQDQIDQLEKLAEEQQKLGEQQKADTEKQEDIKEQFEELEKQIEETKEKNKDLKRPLDIPDTEGDQQEIKMNMDEAQKNSSESNSDQSKRQESQQKAAEQMQEMAEQMQQSMQDSQQEQLQEDIKMVRQLLENLVTLSFDEEEVFNNTSAFNPRSLAYKNLVQDQHNIGRDWGLIKDSLVELSLRQPKIESFISENISEIDKSMSVSIDYLEDRQTSTATMHERRIMTFTNDLALMLDESLQNMQQAMAQKSSTPKMCNNPKNSGQGMPKPMGKITEGQKQLSEEMMKKHEEYQKAQKEGQKMGQRESKGKEGENGEKPGENGKENSKDFAEMAAQQATLRKALEEKMKALQEKGKGDKKLQDLINEMDKVETELVNKNLTAEMMRRQQDIITRLLEAEEAERQQEWDDKRESESADNIENTMPKELEEYLKQRQSEKIEYKSLPAELKPFYQRLVEQYYDKLKS